MGRKKGVEKFHRFAQRRKVDPVSALRPSILYRGRNGDKTLGEGPSGVRVQSNELKRYQRGPPSMVVPIKESMVLSYLSE